MTVRWRAPGRVNLIGEHTDYNDGFVLPIALPMGVTATLARRDDRVLHLQTTTDDVDVDVDLDGLKPGSVEGWAAYVAGVVWALRERGHELGGVDIAVDGDVPAGAGLSSSAALECSVAAALDDLFGLGLARAELVAVARAAENDFVGVPTGPLDQNASMLCERGHALLLDTRSGETRQLPFDLAAAGLALLVIDTRAPHRLVDGEYAKRRSDCEAAAELLGVRSLRDVDPAGLDDALARLDDERLRRRVRHVVSENARVLATVELLDAGLEPDRLGELLTASHASLRDDYEVSSRELDTAVDAAREAGAYGARMTGGGFGGSAIALVNGDAADEITAAVTRAFAAAGLREPRVFTAVAGPGAHRVVGEHVSGRSDAFASAVDQTPSRRRSINHRAV